MIKNRSSQSIGAELVNASTGAAYSGTVTVYVTGDNGTQAIGTVGGGICTDEGNGTFTYNPSRAETNFNYIVWTFTGTGAVPVGVQLYTTTSGGGGGVGTSPSTTFNANAVIAAAFADIGVHQPGESIPAPEANQALIRLNNMISSLGLTESMMPFVSREVFEVTSEESTYTIGPGGDFDTRKPVSIIGAGLLQPTQGATIGRNEIPRAVLTTNAYEAITLKDMQSAMFTDVYYQRTYAGGFGLIKLWPVPNTEDNALVLYRGDLIQGFANLTTENDYPEGLFEALEYNLARRLATVYGGTNWTQELSTLARTSLSEFKRSNYRFEDLAVDPAMTHDRRGGYIIQSGTGGGQA